jgi:hypothetical protein
MGVRWNINLNPVHLARPLYQILATLLHELAHAWQHGWGTPSKPPHHNKEFREKCDVFGIPTDELGHDRGVRHGSPFEAYCRQHAVAFPATPGTAPDAGGGEAPPPILPEPPAKPKGSRLKKWTCRCAVNVRVAISDFDATCNRCCAKFVKVG